MYGCYEYEYDEDFVPRTSNQAFEYLGIILTVSVIASYYRLSKRFLIYSLGGSLLVCPVNELIMC